MPSTGTHLKTAASGEPSAAIASPSAVSFVTLRERSFVAIQPCTASDLHAPMTFSCARPLAAANASVSAILPSAVSAARSASSTALASASGGAGPASSVWRHSGKLAMCAYHRAAFANLGGGAAILR